ncbi:MAG: methyltransferase domain-containing protein [Solirubrobacteraceae bacterium MAG38_C4-C5]|nr:methyltransferase domain-containing protein [Candidatus Siliceabacter maunaloa]
MSTGAPDLVRTLGVDVAGFLRGGLGLGQAARLYVAALQGAGVPVRTTTIDPRMPDVLGAQLKTTEFADLHLDEDLPFNLVCVNAPELPQFAAEAGQKFFADRYTIGVWAWETDLVPASWDPAFRVVDEIWVYSTYVAEILGRAAPCPVVRMPLPIVAPDAAGTRVSLPLPDGFTFLFLFDFYSTLQRKNPLGLLEAFTRAFAPGEGPHLVLKSFNGDYKPDRLACLREAAADRPDVHIVDRFVPEAERAALMAACDCYVSLHRSEGFGLTLGEAMALGKPVIGTGFSSTLDFMTPENSYLVRHTMTTVGPEGENYPAEGRWAEPDLDHAAELMREVWEDQEGARARGARARDDIAAEFSLEAVGTLARERLRRVSGLRALGRGGSVANGGQAAAAGLPNSWLETAELKLSFDPQGDAARAGGLKGTARRAALQGMRPYTYHQDELNGFVVRALREVRERLDDVLIDSQAGQRRLEGQLEALTAQMSELTRAFGPGGLEHVRLQFEGTLARPASTHPALSYRDEHGRTALGFSGVATDDAEGYRGFEDIFRGDEEHVRRTQEAYLDRFADADWVLDLGCGRGEFLDALRERGIAGRGVDLDATMVARCREKGHEVELADASTALRALDDASLPGAFAAQVVEHLDNTQLTELLALLHSKLTPGGVAVFETVNPHNPAALKAFWTDTTHHHPLFPEVLLALCRLAGFDSGEIVFPTTTDNFDRDVYANRDYAVVARRG